MNADGAPMLDPSVLAELRTATGDDDEFIAELIESFRVEGEANVTGLIAAASTGDVPAFGRVAHTLKSTSATVGAMRLSELCRSLEEAARSGRADDLAGDAERVRATWVDTVAALVAAGFGG